MGLLPSSAIGLRQPGQIGLMDEVGLSFLVGNTASLEGNPKRRKSFHESYLLRKNTNPTERGLRRNAEMNHAGHPLFSTSIEQSRYIDRCGRLIISITPTAVLILQTALRRALASAGPVARTVLSRERERLCRPVWS